jgi:hypothetical protein
MVRHSVHVLMLQHASAFLPPAVAVAAVAVAAVAAAGAVAVVPQRPHLI